jgi:hypothetical protein
MEKPASSRPKSIPAVTGERLGQAFSCLTPGQPGEWRTPNWARRFRATLSTQLKAGPAESAALTARVACLLNLFAVKQTELVASGNLVVNTGQVQVSPRLLAAAGRAPVTPTGFPDGWIARALRSTSP